MFRLTGCVSSTNFFSSRTLVASVAWFCLRFSQECFRCYKDDFDCQICGVGIGAHNKHTPFPFRPRKAFLNKTAGKKGTSPQNIREAGQGRKWQFCFLRWAPVVKNIHGCCRCDPFPRPPRGRRKLICWQARTAVEGRHAPSFLPWLSLAITRGESGSTSRYRVQISS